MTAYADTGFLCSLYAPDAHTRRVVARMQRQALPLPLTWLHQLEFRNALRLRVFRGEITPPQRDASLNALLADVAAGVLAGAAPPLADILTEAERLSALHTDTIGTRSLDVLHVSSALVLGLNELLSFDHRQLALAKAAGLKVPIL
jgi:predicted nucleic acid-binding protein